MVDAIINLNFKNMKNIKKILFSIFVFAGFLACTKDVDETLTSGNNAGGLLEKIVPSVTYAQGSLPAFNLKASFSTFQGREKVQSVSVYKQYFGTVGGVSKISNRILLKTITMPVAEQYESNSFTFNYSELSSGLVYNNLPFTTVDTNLAIGDYWELTYVSNLDNGKNHLNAKRTKVNVACGSFLERRYSNNTVRVSNGTIYNYAVDNVRKIADGTYETDYIGNYTCAGQAVATSGNSFQLPAGTRAGFTFTDVCQTIGVETQRLASVYTNDVRQSAAQKAGSSANLVTGIITIKYSIFFTNNTVEREYVTTLTPIP